MNTTTINTESLFTPFQAGSLELANRIVMAPMTRSKSPGHVPGDDVAAYYASRARGGVGLIITEGTTVDHPASNGYPDVPAFFGEASLAGWKKVVDAVHAEGGKIAPQIWHVGPARRPGTQPDPTIPGYGPSEIVEDGKVVVQEMSIADIHQVVQAFGKAAEAAEKIGFDAVEIHGAHEYLIDTFLWAGSNRRNDEYGGTLENRLRCALDVVRAVRHAVSPNFPVIFRFSQWKLNDYSAKLANNEEELARILVPLAEAGVDIFHASTRRFWLPEFEGSTETLSAITKRLTGKPVIAVGNLGVPMPHRSTEPAESFDTKAPHLERAITGIDQGNFDLIAVGRALLSDPQWPNKVRAGRIDDIVEMTPDVFGKLVI